MPESHNLKSERSSFHFQIWDQYLKVLNRIWDLEGTGEDMRTQDHGSAGTFASSPRPRASGFHFKEVLWNENLLELNRSWQVEPKPHFPSPGSWLGYLLFPLKKLILRWVHAYLIPVFSDQREFNAQTVRTFNNMVDQLDAWISKVEYQREVNAKLVQCLNALVDHIDQDVLKCLENKLTQAQQILERESFGLKKQLDERTELFRQLLDERSLKTQQILDERMASLGKETLLELQQKLESCLLGYYIQNRKFEQVLSFLTPEVSRASLPDQIQEELARYRREIDDHKYLQFENQFRGDPKEVKDRQAGYLPCFQYCQQVLDIGCGRGEFLELMKENRIGGYGIDINGEMVAYCAEKGLKAETADALTHLSSLADNSLDGIFSSQVIEHLDPNSLLHLIKLCYAKLKPNAYIVLETVNTSSVMPFLFFFVDLSHKTPLHPQTAEFLMKTHGFTDIKIQYASPIPDTAKLLTFTETIKDTALQNYLQVMNENMKKLNSFLFGYRDYAVIARKHP